MSAIYECIKALEKTPKKWLLMLVLAIFAKGGVFAQDARFSDGTMAQTASQRSGVFSNAGGGMVFDASRSRRTDDGRFWSQIYTGPWGFVNAGSVEFSMGFVFGRVARQSRWCFPILATNVSVIWQAPFAVRGIAPLLGVSFDTVAWARYECLRSDYTLDTLSRHPIGEFSPVKFKLGAGKDFDISRDRFFRARLLGYYGRRFGGNPNPWGGTLRLGVAGRCDSGGT